MTTGRINQSFRSLHERRPTKEASTRGRASQRQRSPPKQGHTGGSPSQRCKQRTEQANAGEIARPVKADDHRTAKAHKSLFHLRTHCKSRLRGLCETNDRVPYKNTALDNISSRSQRHASDTFCYHRARHFAGETRANRINSRPAMP